MQTVIGLYAQLAQAEEAVRDLRSSGFTNDQVSVIVRGAQDEAGADEGDGGERAAARAGVGATLGGIAGLLLGIGAVALPGIGPVVAAGPVISTLAGAGLGAVGGSLTGALADWGVPEQHAAAYAEGIRRGEALVLVRAEQNQSQRAAGILNRYGPVDIARRTAEGKEKQTAEGAKDAERRERGTAKSAEIARGRRQGTAESAESAEERERGTAEAAEYAEGRELRNTGTEGVERDDAVFQSVENRAERPVSSLDTLIEGQAGEEAGVRAQEARPQALRPPQEQEMDLRRERIVVEPAEQPPAADGEAPGRAERAGTAPWQPFEEGVVEFETVSEEPLVEKRTRIRETLQVVKEVQHERFPPAVHLDPEGDLIQPQTDPAGELLIAPTGGLPEPQQLTVGSRSLEPDFRQHYDLTYGDSSSRGDRGQLAYEQVVPAYAFGLELAASPRYAGYAWAQLEPPARQLWQQRHPALDWESLRGAVRYAWNLGGEQGQESQPDT